MKEFRLDRLILFGTIAVMVLFLGSALMRVWGHLIDPPKNYQAVAIVPIEKLLQSPLTYLAKDVIVQGYLHLDHEINNGIAVLYPTKETALKGKFGTYLQLPYPEDGKSACLDHMVEVYGRFVTVWPDPEFPIPVEGFGLVEIGYLGKIEDVAGPLGAGLLRASCPSLDLPEEFGVKQ